MITACMVAIFLVAFFLGKKEVELIVLILSFFVPDELPFIDEVVEVALFLGSLRKSNKVVTEGKRIDRMTNFDQ